MAIDNQNVTQSHMLLGVSETASLQEIRAAFRKMVIKCHPDTGGTDESLKAVIRAYENLTKPSQALKETRFQQQGRSMQKAAEWCAESSAFGVAQFGNLVLEKHDRTVKITGRIKAGKFRFDGRMILYGDVSGPTWQYGDATTLEADSISIHGNMRNRVNATARSISTHNMFGPKHTKRDKTRAAAQRDSLPHARLSADKIRLHRCTGRAVLNGKIIDLYDLQDGCDIRAQYLTVRGNTITHDCTIRITKSMRFTTSHVHGLSDDCIVSWNEKSVKLGMLKTYMIGNLPGFEGVPGTILGNGFVIDTDMLDHIVSKRRWNLFRRT